MLEYTILDYVNNLRVNRELLKKSTFVRAKYTVQHEMRLGSGSQACTENRSDTSSFLKEFIYYTQRIVFTL